MRNETLQEFTEEFDECAVCWAKGGLEIHHLVGGPGRKHIRENLLRLCRDCHYGLHSGGQKSLSKGQVLLAKMESDTRWFDPEALAALQHKKALSYGPEALPAWVYAARRSRPIREEWAMPINSRSKGKRGELEVAHAINREFPHARARRAAQHSGTESTSDVLAPGLGPVWLEVKRVERLNIHQAMEKAVEQAGSQIPVIVHRRNDTEYLLTIRLTDARRFLKEVG
jgi:hypothetical protein